MKHIRVETTGGYNKWRDCLQNVQGRQELPSITRTMPMTDAEMEEVHGKDSQNRRG